MSQDMDQEPEPNSQLTSTTMTAVQEQPQAHAQTTPPVVTQQYMVHVFLLIIVLLTVLYNPNLKAPNDDANDGSIPPMVTHNL